jgi:pseudouridine-5'-phosphate glycosidase
MVVANPIPLAEEIPEAEISLLITRAVNEAEETGITGAAITPFLLGRIVELSDGESLRANIALVKNNAALGARIAVAYAGS